jgi:phenylalanyl-tRNA synthetase beta chain
MKISLNWLREYGTLPESVSELAELLTRAGVEVEEVITHGVDLPEVVVAQIVSSDPHPNADRLSVCQVDDGSGEPRQIVCGAKNYQVGDKVPLALPGAILPGDFKIKVGKLRGVKSEGMMAAAEELGLPKAGEGLLILPQEARVGAPLSEIFPAESVLDLEITPNRPDLLSHVGMAREVAALTGAAWQDRPFVEGDLPSVTAPVAIETPLCSLYTLQALHGVTVGPSPDWLRKKLEAVGLRSINTIVDVTNFVLFETGQPLHAFDADKIEGEILVRPAGESRDFEALDEQRYALDPGDVVIADASGPVALAGVMGGRHSGVTATTCNLLLESACFDAGQVRKTSRRLGLASDSSHRFERGVDPAGVLPAARRAVEMILELAGGSVGELRVTGPVRDPIPARVVPLRLERLAAVLGIPVSADKVDAILTGFGLGKTGQGWEIPTFRQDLTREVDLIEEIARVIGMGAIPSRISATPAVPGEADVAYDFQMDLRRKLVAQGLNEARTSALVSSGGGCEEALRLRNPLGEDQAFLRTSLVPGLLTALTHNIRQGMRRVALFEIGRTFHAGNPEESMTLALVLNGVTAAADWRGTPARAFDWHDARGRLEALLPAPCQLRPTTAKVPFALVAEILVGECCVGVLGQLAPSEAKKLDAEGPVLAAEISLVALRGLGRDFNYREFPRFPAMGRDIALLCPLDLSYADVERTLREANEKLLVQIEPFDVFIDPTGEKVPRDRKSIGISLTFRAPTRTLNSEEVNTAFESLKESLGTKLAVDFR